MIRSWNFIIQAFCGVTAVVTSLSAFAQTPAPRYWFGPNDLQFSSLYFPLPKETLKENKQCAVVTVHSLLRISKGTQSTVYSQQGVGWVIVDERSRLSILTPAHVVKHGQILIAQCDTKMFYLKPANINETLDLALLEFESSNTREPGPEISLTPLLWFNSPGLAKMAASPFASAQPRVTPVVAHPDVLFAPGNRARIYYVEPGKELKPSLLEGTSYGTSAQISAVTGHTALTGHNQAFVYVNSGVRPGMSGSIMMVRTLTDIENSKSTLSKSDYVLGMVLKSGANGSNSLAAPITSIAQFIHGLSVGDQYDPFAEDGVTMQSQLGVDTRGRLAKSFEVVVQDHVLNKELRFKEICSDQFPETSN